MLDLTLYLVTDSTGLEEPVFLERIEQACRGGITLLQLREKEKSGRDYFELARKVKSISDRYHIPLIIDDRADIAAAVDAAGVHVGQSDLPVFAARALLGPGKIVGATAKTVEQAQKATREGVDYLGVGAIYPTTTKVKTVLTPVSTLGEICRSVSIPVAAIGGLNEENCDILRGVPIAGISVVSAVMKAADPCWTAAELRAKVTELLASQS
ncbi:thiamine phosphate synthase [Faecalispora jeddahensis]|uniref:thiamine phosphate synthase n=1 Tax=Faecalispora jeddahensis TaxID=1414721 RepID=UPI00145A6CC2|nr:thiamine phosphate synthase [Faecalispora jeddahensis]